MNSSILNFLFALLLPAGTFATIIEEGGGIIYGKDHTFSLKAPKGWMLDNESAVEQGVHAVFYPKGGTWKDSRIVAYAQARPKTDKIATADDVAKSVVADFHANGSPKLQAKRIKTLKTDAGREAVIYHFTGDQWGNSEAVAYYVEEKTINFVVMNSRDAKLFAASQGAFEALAKSYVFLGDRPIVAAKGGAAVEELAAEPFKEAQARAHEMGKTAEGKAYEQRFSEAIGEPLQAALRDCAKDAKPKQEIRMIFVIGIDGAMQRVVCGERDAVSVCVGKKLSGTKLPAPPKADWMVLFKLTLK